MQRASWLWIGLLAAACDGGPVVVSCEADEECELGAHCSSDGRCDLICRVDADCADLGGATCDERGRCVSDEPDCTSDAQCDDGEPCTEDACEAGGCVHRPISGCAPCEIPDADGDGVDRIECGGDDCDDGDANRFPGNPEVCDAEGHDEDCDPNTLGPDADGDGYVSDQCCNGTVCGRDCDDGSMNISPVAPEACNGVDDDCNGLIDDDAGIWFYDGDGDGYGRDDDVVRGCTAPTGYVSNGGDCNDDARGIHPGATETCDELDNDCDGTIDVLADGTPCMCTIGRTQICGAPDGSGGFLTLGACRTGTQNCIDGRWGECVGDVQPSNPPAENESVCNGIDDDCDGTVDDGLLVMCLVDGDNDRYAGAGSASMRCPDPSRPAYGSCPAGYVAPSASLGADCDDTNGGYWRLLSVRTDADNDGYCVGAAFNQCTGTAARPGTRLAGSCSSTNDDCDGNASAYRNVTVYADADGDNYCTGSSTMCIGATPPAGFRLSCAGYTDCAASDPGRYRIIRVRLDLDSDVACAGAEHDLCVGPPSPSYLYTGVFGNRREAWHCRAGVEDCNDLNNCVSTDCSHREVQVIPYLGHACPGERRAGPTPAVCPAGYAVSTRFSYDRCYRDYRGVGGGNCTVGGDPISGCTITQTCNFLEATTCGVTAICDPIVGYVGSC